MTGNGVGPAQEAQLALGILIFIVTIVPWMQASTTAIMILKAYDTIAAMRWFAIVEKMLLVVFAVQWAVYALRSENFGNSSWAINTEVDTPNPGEAGYNYAVINIFMMVFLGLVKSQTWFLSWLGENIEGYTEVVTKGGKTTQRKQLHGVEYGFYVVYVTLIVASAVTITTLVWKAYDIRTSDWKFVAAFWIVATIFFFAWWLVLLIYGGMRAYKKDASAVSTRD